MVITRAIAATIRRASDRNISSSVVLQKSVAIEDPDLARDTVLLRAVLAAFTFAAPSQRRDGAIPVSSLSVTSHRKKLRAWRGVIRDSTHLFNIVARVSCSEPDGSSDPYMAFLLAGDADNRLWPEVLADGVKRYDAMQVPHHGSEENVYRPAYDLLDCARFVVSADAYKGRRHPSKLLGQTLTASPKVRELYCTNEHRCCELRNHPGADCLATRTIALFIGQEQVRRLRDEGSDVTAEPCRRLLPPQ